MRTRTKKWIRRLPWILALSLLVSCAMAVYIREYEQPVYRAEYTLYAVPEGDSDTVYENARMLARDCNLLIGTETFRKSIEQKMQSSGSNHVSMRAVEGTHMLKVQAIGPDAQELCLLADAVGDQVCERIPRMFGATSVQTVERAVLPAQPYTAYASWRIVAAFLAAFAVFALLACCIPETNTRVSVHSPSAEAFCLGTAGDARRLARRYLRKIRKRPDSGMLLWQADHSHREEIRQLVLRLRTSMKKNGGHSIVLTAMSNEEDSEAAAVLLASEMAQQSFRVLLLELSGRDSRMARLVNVKPKADLYDYLMGRAVLNEVIVAAKIENLSFVDSLHPEKGVADLAATKAFSEFLRSTESRFDYVILHAAPRSISSDACMLALTAEATLLVACESAYTLEEIEGAAREFARVGRPAKGVVFTRARA